MLKDLNCNKGRIWTLAEFEMLVFGHTKDLVMYKKMDAKKEVGT